MELNTFAFPKPWIVEKIGKETFRFVYDFIYIAPTGLVFRVPRGFVTDGASIPRPFWTLIGHPFREYTFAASIHDMLYAIGDCTRKEADVVFHRAMGDEGVARWKRDLMYRAVRMGGAHAWEQARARYACVKLPQAVEERVGKIETFRMKTVEEHWQFRFSAKTEEGWDEVAVSTNRYDSDQAAEAFARDLFLREWSLEK